MDAPLYSSDYIVLTACMKLRQTFREGSYTSNQQLFVVAESYFSVVSNITPVPVSNSHTTIKRILVLNVRLMADTKLGDAGVYYKVLFTMCFFGRPGFKRREVALVWHKNDMKAPK